jgi:hypothetical protein
VDQPGVTVHQGVKGRLPLAFQPIGKEFGITGTGTRPYHLVSGYRLSGYAGKRTKIFSGRENGERRDRGRSATNEYQSTGMKKGAGVRILNRRKAGERQEF